MEDLSKAVCNNDDENTSIAARSLLTLNTNQSVGPSQNTNQSVQGPCQNGYTSLVQSSSNFCDFPDGWNDSLTGVVHVGSVAVRVDRSTGNPNIQIIQTKNYEQQQAFKEQKMKLSPTDVAEEQIFSKVTAVIKKRPDISIQKYLTVCKNSDAVTVCKDETVSISGSLSTVNSIYESLKVLYENKAVEKSSTVWTDESADTDDDDMVSEEERTSAASDSKTVPQTPSGDSVSVLKTLQTSMELCDHASQGQRDDISLSVSHPIAQGEVIQVGKGDNITVNNSFKCLECNKIFQTSQFLIQHKEESHGPYICSVCGKEFALKRYLSMHMKRHSDGNKKHVCNVCGWKFLERYKLKLHMESHKPKSEKNLPHSCEICNGQFYNKAALDDHMNTHTGNRPFTCEFCNCSFAHRIGLRRHMVTHSTSKPFKCDICLKEFSFKAKLDEHFITHTGEGKYVCGNCGKIFTTKSSLKRHCEKCVNKAKEQSSEAVFMCGICSLVFDTLEKASIHAATHET